MFETGDGAALTHGHLATKVDFDVPEARPLVERFSVLNLPTVVILDGSGQEVERIQGYDSKADWLEQARAALVASDPMSALEARARENPGDAAAQLELGWRFLVRGRVEQGEALLERAILLDPTNAGGHASAALFVMGRYHQRVRLDFRTGRNLWRELATRFPESDEAIAALSWWAKAQVELGQIDLGAEVLRRAARAPGATPTHVLLWASYASKHGVDREAARAAVSDALPRAEGEIAEELRDLLEELGRPPAP